MLLARLNSESPSLPIPRDEFDKLLLQSDFLSGTGYSWLRVEDRPKAIARLKELYKVTDPEQLDPPTQKWFEQFLLAAQDAETTKEVVKRYYAGDDQAERMLGMYGREAALRHYMPIVENGDTKERGGADNFWESAMDGAAVRSFRVISRSEFFPPATKKWAGHLAEIMWLTPHWGGREGKATAQLRDWWKHNQKAVLAGEYAKADWLPSGPPIMPTGRSGAEERGEVPAPKAASPDRLQEARPPEPLSSLRIWWLPLGLAGLLAACGFWVWRLRQGKRTANQRQ